jgi:hypothetical protein
MRVSNRGLAERARPLLPLARSERLETRNLLIRRFLCGRPVPFRSVRDLGLVSAGCPGWSVRSEGCSSVWLPAWLPAASEAMAHDGVLPETLVILVEA